MPAPRELLQQIPVTRAKARMQKHQGGGKFLVQMPGVSGGGGRMVMAKINSCINCFSLHAPGPKTAGLRLQDCQVSKKAYKVNRPSLKIVNFNQ